MTQSGLTLVDFFNEFMFQGQIYEQHGDEKENPSSLDVTVLKYVPSNQLFSGFTKDNDSEYPITGQIWTDENSVTHMKFLESRQGNIDFTNSWERPTNMAYHAKFDTATGELKLVGYSHTNIDPVRHFCYSFELNVAPRSNGPLPPGYLDKVSNLILPKFISPQEVVKK